MQQYLQNKKGLVQNVFDQVYDQYDLMNDFMSFGIHRIWKKSLLNMMNPSKNKKLIDVACGTGDIAKLYLKYVNELSEITCVDPNKGMINKGKEKLDVYKNLKWLISPAEKLPVIDNSSSELSTSDTETVNVKEESSSKETEKSSTIGASFTAKTKTLKS